MAERLSRNNFDLLRILAAAQVLVSHTVAHLAIPKPTGWSLLEAFPGVPVFFVISGFLISASYERSSSVWSYYRNRALRIFPGMWCCVLVTILVASIFGFSFFNRQAIFWVLCQMVGAIYTPGFLRGFGFGSYNGSLWTIPIELQFYLALPVIYRMSRKATHQTLAIGVLWLVFTCVACFSYRVFAPLGEPENEPIGQKLLRYSFLPHIYMFLAGVLLQRLRVYEYRWIAGKALYWLGFYVACVYLLPASAVASVGNSLLMGVFVISAAYTAPGVAKRLLRGNDISYGVYIYHGLLINIFVELGLLGRGFYLFVLAGLACVMAYLSWIGVERPFLRKKQQTIHPTTTGLAPV
jgi:peptidoglycan/LPS O-acetylase OafA/YrhL